MRWNIDINCDLGEGLENESQIMPYISSCNIACGGHAGDTTSIHRCLKLAKQHSVKVGVHPSFEDRAHFGRRMLEISESRFRESVTQQIHLFLQEVNVLEMDFHHIKMHGALYHATANQTHYANWLVRLMKDQFHDIPLYLPPGSLLEQLCLNEGIAYFKEGFADRAYQGARSLVSRGENGAVLSDAQAVINQISSMVIDQQVQLHSGNKIDLEVDTICLHGDHLETVNQLPYIMEELQKRDIYLDKA
ncbi:LamB/YcsF family protein [Nonlabens xiamenensis]|uniref:LamB/YcsF family protein n=1 Tax=Nonlabens xiamenensis TaxID=2341043 RepID=UPI000F60D78D|nr:LamB/YcsF family protein [Nonlabens xiamenensis]